MKAIFAALGVVAICILSTPVVANAAPLVTERQSDQSPQPLSDDEMAHVVGGQINVPPPTGGGGGTPPPPPVNPLLNALDRLEQTLARRTGLNPESFPAIERLESLVTRFLNSRH